MINECLMELRKKNSLTLVSEDEADDVTFHDGGLEQIDAFYIVQAIKTLPSGYRTVLNLFSIEGYSHAEIASMLGINESTSRSQLNKAKKLLRHKLSQEADYDAKRKI